MFGRIDQTLLWAAGLSSAAALLSILPLQLPALSMIGVGAAVLLLRRPLLVWPILGFLLPIAAGHSVGPVSGLDLLLALAVALWFVDGARRGTLPLKWYPPAVLVFIYCATLLVSTTFQATDLGEAVREVIKWLELVVLLLLVRAMMRPAGSQWLVVALLLAAVGQAFLGIYQFLFQVGPDWFIILDRFMRASGSFRQPNPYAGYLGMTLPVAVSLALWSWGDLMRPWRQRHTRPREWGWTEPRVVGLLWAAGYTAAAGLIAAGLLASWSRGGWLGAAAGVGVVLLLRSRKAMVAGLLMIGLLLVISLLGTFSPATLPEPVAARLSDVPNFLGISGVEGQPVTDANFSVIERIAHWIAAVRMWESAPWLGIGPGNYAVAYPLYQLPRWDDPLGHAHNYYLNVLAETGIFGFTVWAALWIGVVAWLVQQARRTGGSGWNRAFVLGVLGVVVHLSVHNFFDNLLVQGMYLHVGLWLACAGISRQAESGGEIP